MSKHLFSIIGWFAIIGGAAVATYGVLDVASYAITGDALEPMIGHTHMAFSTAACMVVIGLSLIGLGYVAKHQTYQPKPSTGFNTARFFQILVGAIGGGMLLFVAAVKAFVLEHDRLPYLVLLLSALVMFGGSLHGLAGMHHMRRNPIVERVALWPIATAATAGMLLLLLGIIVLTGERPQILLYLQSIPYAVVGFVGFYVGAYFRGMVNGRDV